MSGVRGGSVLTLDDNIGSAAANLRTERPRAGDAIFGNGIDIGIGIGIGIDIDSSALRRSTLLQKIR